MRFCYELSGISAFRVFVTAEMVVLRPSQINEEHRLSAMRADAGVRGNRQSRYSAKARMSYTPSASGQLFRFAQSRETRTPPLVPLTDAGHFKLKMESIAREDPWVKNLIDRLAGVVHSFRASQFWRAIHGDARLRRSRASLRRLQRGSLRRSRLQLSENEGGFNWSSQHSNLLSKMECGHETATSHLLLGSPTV
jgi:hypothetical protein